MFSFLEDVFFLFYWKFRHDPMERALQELGKHPTTARQDIPKRHAVTFIAETRNHCERPDITKRRYWLLSEAAQDLSD